MRTFFFSCSAIDLNYGQSLLSYLICQHLAFSYVVKLRPIFLMRVRRLRTVTMKIEQAKFKDGPVGGQVAKHRNVR